MKEAEVLVGAQWVTVPLLGPGDAAPPGRWLFLQLPPEKLNQTWRIKQEGDPHAQQP